jgi:hypothetical protein
MPIDPELRECIEDAIGTVENLDNNVEELGGKIESIGDTIGNNSDGLIECIAILNSSLIKINNTLNVIALSISENTHAIRNPY